MSLRAKLLLILGAIWIMVSLIIFFDSRLILARDYENLEQQLMVKNVNRVEKAFDNMYAALKLYGESWSVWDDAYRFLKDKNAKFIASNMVSGTYTSSNINFFFFFDNNGKYFFGQHYDLSAKKFKEVPKSLIHHLEARPEFVKHDNINSGRVGIIKIPEGFVVMSSLPVLTSDRKGPVAGSELLGYFLDEKHINNLSDTVGLKLAFFPVPIEKDAELQEAYGKLNAGEEFYIAPKGNNLSYAYMLIRDIDGKSAGLLKVELPRLVYQEGLNTVNRYFIIVIALGVIILFALWVLLKLFVLNPIIKIGDSVVDIYSKNNFSKRLVTTGSDELNRMKVAINSMLEIIELSQEQLKYRITKRSAELEHLSLLNKNLFAEMHKQKDVEVQLRDAEKLLRQLAYYDDLTGLPNRMYFMELLKNVVNAAKRDQSGFAVLFLDADKFKLINDTYGHDIGDQFLQHVGNAIKESVKKNDIVARLSGDEFIIVLNKALDRALISNVAKRLLEAVSVPLFVNGNDLELSFSIGISLYPSDGTKCEELIRHSDIAMYYAKKNKGNTFCFYDTISEKNPFKQG